MKIEFRRMLYSRGFYTAVLVMVIAQFIGGYQELWFGFTVGMESGLPYGYFLDAFRTSLSSNIIMFSIPFLSSLPYSTSFLEDISGGYIKFYLPRKGRKQYIKDRIFINAISGGLCADFAIFISITLFALLFKPLENLPEIPLLQEQSTLLHQQCFAFLLEKLYLFFLCGCFWATIGALIGTVNMNRYLSYLSPFIVYYLLIIFTERYFLDCYILNPKEWLFPQQTWPFGVLGLSFIIILLCISMMIIFAFLLNRRIQDV